MRYEVRGTRKRGDGSRTTESIEKGRMFHMEQQNMEKEEESSTWNNQKARKNHLGGGGFGVMNYNKNGEISENPHGRIDVLTLDYQLILLYMIYYDLFNDK